MTDRYDVVVNSPVPLPGGAWELEAVVDLFQPDTLTIAPTERDIAERQPPPEQEWYREWVKSTYRIQYAKQGDLPVRMHFSLRTVVEERGTSTSDAQVLVKLDDQGHPDWVYSSQAYAYDDWETGTRETLIKLSKDSRGRITGWEQVSLTRGQTPDGKQEFGYRHLAVPAAGT